MRHTDRSTERIETTKRTVITQKRTSQGERGDKIRSKKYYMKVISVRGDGRIVQGNLTFDTSNMQ